jgi:PAS domain S-box-containing protein/putative nucleotidyltransferase with HDIG domain
MRIQYRLLILSGILGILFLAGFYFLTQTQLTSVSLLISDQKSKLDQLFREMVNLEGRNLETLVFDYTYWDELVSFVSTKDASFAANVLDESLDGYGVDAIWVYSPDFEQVYFSRRGGDQDPINLPVTRDELPAVFQGTPFAHFNFLMADGSVMEIRASTIHPSADVAHATLSKGILFVGKIWNSERLSYLSNLTGSKVEIVGRQTTPAVNPDPMSELTVLHALPGLYGQPAAYIVGRFANQYASGFTQAKQRDLIYYCIYAFIFMTVLFGGISLWVTRPLSSISTSFVQQNSAPLKQLVHEHNEFGHIARLTQTFFEQRDLMAGVIEKHERAEKALRESEERYRIVTDLTSDAAYALQVVSHDQVILEWGGETIQRLLGYQFDQFKHLSDLLAVIHPDDRFVMERGRAQIFAGEPVSVELRILHSDCSMRWIRAHFYPMLDTQTGQLSRLYGAVQDITIEKSAQEAYRALVDNSLYGLVIFQDQLIRFTNPALVQMTGYTVEEILALTPAQIFGLIHPTERIGARDLLEKAQQNDHLTDMVEMRLRLKNGTWHWFEISTVSIEYHGRPAIQVTFHDINGRKMAEQALAQHQQYSSAILNTVDALVMILDPQGKIISCNPAGLQILQVESQDLYEKSLWDVVSIPVGSPIADDHFSAQVETLTPVRDVDLWVRHPKGRVWLSWSQNYLMNADGKVAAVVGSANDISERKIRERQRESLATIASAVRANTTRSEVASATLQAFNDFMQVESVAIGFPDPQSNHIKLEFVTGSLSQQLAGQILPMENSMSGEVYHTGKPYLTNNLKDEHHFYTKDLLDTLNASAWVPMVVDGSVTGVVITSSSRPIDQAEFTALIPIADMAASAFHRASLAEQMQRRLQHLTTLRAINVSIGSSFDLRVTLNLLVNQIHTQLGVDAVSVLLLDSETRMLHCAAGNGFRSQNNEQLNFWLGEGQAGRIAMERRTQQIYDPEGIQTYFDQREWLAGEEFVAYNAVPMIVKGVVKGVLETFHRAPYTQQTDFIQLLEALAMETAIAIDKAELLEMLQHSNQDLVVAYDKTIEGWARAIEMRDEETEDHTRRVAEYTMRLAQAYGMTGAQLMYLRRGALLHDLGKIAVPDRILLKPGELTADEWVVMRKHPGMAYEMLSSIEFLRTALDIPYCHHEHWDGGGYPRGLAGTEIPVAARLFSVIDVWDALRHDRPYLQEQAGKTLDPEIVGIFLGIRPLILRSEPRN